MCKKTFQNLSGLLQVVCKQNKNNSFTSIVKTEKRERITLLRNYQTVLLESVNCINDNMFSQMNLDKMFILWNVCNFFCVNR